MSNRDGRWTTATAQRTINRYVAARHRVRGLKALNECIPPAVQPYRQRHFAVFEVQRSLTCLPRDREPALLRGQALF